jgi:hypothetical protein
MFLTLGTWIFFYRATPSAPLDTLETVVSLAIWLGTLGIVRRVYRVVKSRVRR